jgi:hypothetical protein
MDDNQKDAPKATTKQRVKRTFNRVKKHISNNNEFYVGTGIGLTVGFVLRDNMPTKITDDNFYASAKTWEHMRDCVEQPHTITTKWGDFNISPVND